MQIWRRSYDIPPPELADDDKRHPKFDPRYKEIPAAQLPRCESLQDTEKRFLPFWHERIAPVLGAGKKVLVVAHGNSLRALVKYLDKIPNDKIVDLNIPTGVPLVYKLDKNLQSQGSRYLGNPEDVKARISGVANQLKKN